MIHQPIFALTHYDFNNDPEMAITYMPYWAFILIVSILGFFIILALVTFFKKKTTQKIIGLSALSLIFLYPVLYFTSFKTYSKLFWDTNTIQTDYIAETLPNSNKFIGQAPKGTEKQLTFRVDDGSQDFHDTVKTDLFMTYDEFVYVKSKATDGTTRMLTIPVENITITSTNNTYTEPTLQESLRYTQNPDIKKRIKYKEDLYKAPIYTLYVPNKSIEKNYTTPVK